MDFEDAPCTTAAATIEHADLAELASRLTNHEEDRRLQAALANYDEAWRMEFAGEFDHVRLLGQDNLRRYVPFATVCVRITAADTWFDVVARVGAARVTGARVVASFAEACTRAWHDRLEAATETWSAGIELVEQPDDDLISLLQTRDVRIRYAARDRVPKSLRQAAASLGTWIADVPVVATGRVELLWYLREQSLSYDYHRYGNLGRRSHEHRRPLPGATPQ